MTFNESYREILNIVKGDIDRVNAELSNAFSVETSVHEELQCFLNTSSKRIRPVMTFLYLRAAGIEVTDDQIQLQTIVEMIHNASLIHDDVIDGDSKRRGKKTFNCEFGNRLAIVAGDYLLSVVMKKLTALKSFEIFNLFGKTIENMCSGEIQQHLSLNKIPSIEEYLDKSYLKTGSLFEAAITGAVILAGETKIIRAVEFGRNFGIAFQIRDDLLNILEKDSSDIAEGIYNAPVIYSGMTGVTSSGIEKTKDLLNNYLNRAAECISDLPENAYKAALTELSELLKND